MKFLFFILLIALDFFSKKIIFNLVSLNNFIELMPFIDITHIHNYGVSFGLFAGILHKWFIVLVGLIIIILLFIWMLQSSNKFEKLGVLLVIAGAISNILDRIINNYVLDFIYLHYKDFYWPAFNFADIYISVGIVIIVIESCKIYKTRLIKKHD